MADELGGGITIPGTGLDAGPKGIIQQLMKRADESAAYTAGAEGEIKASQAREAAARQAQGAALGPKRAELKSKLAETPKAPEFAAQPEAPHDFGIDPKEMNETLSLVTALAAVGGLLTRQPLTAALNNFAQGIHGFVQGKQEVFKNELKSFEANLKKSNAENETIWRKYKAAQDKYGTDIQALQNEISVIAAETQNPIDMELAKRGDIVSLMKLHEQTNNNYNKVLETTARFMQQAEDKRLQREQQAATAAQASADRRAAMQIAHEDRVAAEAGRGQRAAADRESREDIAAMLEAGREGRAVDRIALERERMKERAAASGGKPSPTERQHYVDSNQLLKSVDRVESMLHDPALRQKIDDAKLGGILSDTVESKLIQQYLVRPNIDPDVKKYLQEISVLRNQYYLDQSGKAVTGGEALRNYGAIMQPGDSTEDVVNKLAIVKNRASEKMKDYETYFPSLKAIRPGAGGGAPAVGEKRTINGVPAHWDGKGWLPD